MLLAGLVAVLLWMWLLGRYYPGSGLEQLGLKSAREITETREALEAEDLDQMIAARNARRRAKGEPEVSTADYELRVAGDIEKDSEIVMWQPIRLGELAFLPGSRNGFRIAGAKAG